MDKKSSINMGPTVYAETLHTSFLWCLLPDVEVSESKKQIRVNCVILPVYGDIDSPATSN